MTHHLKKIFQVCLVACLAVTAASCDVHEFGNAVPDDDSQKAADITLHLDFNTIMPLHRELIYTRNSSDADIYDVYYHVELYRMNQKGEYNDDPEISINYVDADVVNLDHDIRVRLSNGTYRVVAWTHFVEDNEIYKHFEVNNLKFASISDHKAYTGNTDMADAYRGISYITIDNDNIKTDTVYTVDMNRPVAKFEIYATDVDQFLNLTESSKKAAARSAIEEGKYTVRVKYNGYVGSKYNLISDYVADSRTNLYFTGPITMIDDHEARLGFDYLFVNVDGGGVTLSMEICNEAGERVATVSNIEVPLRQGHLTVLRGEFMSSKSDGIGISTDFIGPDINIRF